MAVSAVYARLAHIARFDGAQTLDAATGFSNIGSTTAAFQLSGGRYALDVIGTSFGHVILQVLGLDGSTYLTVQDVTANGHVALDLAAGTYKLALS